MGMNQQDKDNLRNNWEQAKQEIRTRFSGVTDADLQNQDPDALVASISSRTGQSEEEVQRTLSEISRSSGTSS